MSITACVVQLAARAAEPREARLVAVGELLADVRADVIVLPELWPTGFFAFDRYRAESEPMDGPTVDALAAAARRARAWIVGGSLIERTESGSLHNTAVVIDPTGGVVGSYRKTHLFGVESRERELLGPGDSLTIIALPWANLGLSLCYDLRFPELYRALVTRGAEILVVSAAWPAVRRAHWELLLQARAVENQAFVLGCGGGGADNGVSLAGASMIVGPSGEILARADDAEQRLLYAELDLDALRALRAAFPVLSDRRIQSDDDVRAT